VLFVYLMHMLVISVAFKFTRRLVVASNFALSCLVQIVVLGTCINFCFTVFYVLIERPRYGSQLATQGVREAIEAEADAMRW
jgi:hypothetical protein